MNSWHHLNNVLSLYNRFFNVSTPLLDLTTLFVSQYIVNNLVIPGTIVSDVLNMGMSPISCAFTKNHINNNPNENGVVDSLRSLIYHEHFK